MNSRFLGLRRLTARAMSSGPKIRTLQYNPVRYYRVSQDCDAHMNELPIPCGPWGPWYNAKQNFYNKVFVGGLLWFLFSGLMMLWTDSIYLNWGPPPQPGPPSDMVVECEDPE